MNSGKTDIQYWVASWYMSFLFCNCFGISMNVVAVA